MSKRTKAPLTAAEKKFIKHFGETVRQIRENKKLTVYDVTGDDMPIKSRQHWQKMENGLKNITLATVYKIAETLDVKANELLKK